MGISVKHELKDNFLEIIIHNNGEYMGTIAYSLTAFLNIENYSHYKYSYFLEKKNTIDFLANKMILNTIKNTAGYINIEYTKKIAKALSKRYNIYKDISWADFIKKIIGDVEYVEYFVKLNS